jgi:hypothetical protein
MYPQYKAHRHQHPPSLTRAISRILAVVEAMGIPVVAVPGVEADDVVGTLATKAEQDGFGSVVIMSTDKVGCVHVCMCVCVGGCCSQLWGTHAVHHCTFELAGTGVQLAARVLCHANHRAHRCVRVHVVQLLHTPAVVPAASLL